MTTKASLIGALHPTPRLVIQEPLTALFLKLLAQHGDDFKRIAASMANKVCPVHTVPLWRKRLTRYRCVHRQRSRSRRFTGRTQRR